MLQSFLMLSTHCVSSSQVKHHDGFCLMYVVWRPWIPSTCRPQTTHSNAPAYIFNMLQQVSTLQRQTNLRFATNSDLLILHTRLLLSELALSSAASCISNAIYPNVKRTATLLTLKKELETYLFSKHICRFIVFYHYLLLCTCILVNSWSSSM